MIVLSFLVDGTNAIRSSSLKNNMNRISTKHSLEYVYEICRLLMIFSFV